VAVVPVLLGRMAQPTLVALAVPLSVAPLPDRPSMQAAAAVVVGTQRVARVVGTQRVARVALEMQPVQPVL
jgi:hypothetical protein